MKKDKLSKEAQNLDNKINELAGTTTRKLKKTIKWVLPISW